MDCGREEVAESYCSVIMLSVALGAVEEARVQRVVQSDMRTAEYSSENDRLTVSALWILA